MSCRDGQSLNFSIVFSSKLVIFFWSMYKILAQNLSTTWISCHTMTNKKYVAPPPKKILLDYCTIHLQFLKSTFTIHFYYLIGEKMSEFYLVGVLIRMGKISSPTGIFVSFPRPNLQFNHFHPTKCPNELVSFTSS